jgi:hypothetical protein
VLRDIGEGRIQCLAVDTPVPSQFSHEILNANPYAYLDDAPLEERRARAVEMRRMLPEAVLSEVGRLDPMAIAEVCADAWPDVRDAEELHDALLSLVAMPSRLNGGVWPGSRLSAKLQESIAAWGRYFEQLAVGRRAGVARVGDATFWVAAERVRAFEQIYPGARFESPLPEVDSPAKSREDRALDMATVDAPHRAGDGRRTWERAWAGCGGWGKGNVAAGSERRRAAGAVHGFICWEDGMVRPSVAGANSQVDFGFAAEAGRVGDGGAIHALAAAMAACGSQ